MTTSLHRALTKRPINPPDARNKASHRQQFRHYIFQMRIEGTLSKWNDNRGFGFITPTHGDQAIFVHISAFPTNGIRPTLGATLTFEIETDNNGRKQAKNILYPQRPSVKRPPPPRKPIPHHRQRRSDIRGWSIVFLILVSLGVYGYEKLSPRTSPSPAITTAPNIPEAAPPYRFPEAASPYRCDGRTYCSQMTSCAEATFFLKNCPDVRMDGNRDGVPCEQQWCTSPFAK